MSTGGSVATRELVQYQPVCEWCGGNVGSWYSHRPTVLRILAIHRQIHRVRNLVGRSVRTK